MVQLLGSVISKTCSSHVVLEQKPLFSNQNYNKLKQLRASCVQDLHITLQPPGPCVLSIITLLQVLWVLSLLLCLHDF